MVKNESKRGGKKPIQQPQNVTPLRMTPSPSPFNLLFPPYFPPPQNWRKGNSSSQLVKIMLLITPDLL